MCTGTLYWVPTSPEPQRPPTGLLRTSAKSMELTKEGERMAQEGEPAPENDRANGGPAQRQTGRAKKRAKEDHATAGDPNIH